MHTHTCTRTYLLHRCQHPVTGLLPAFLYEDLTPGWAKNDAWVRDNVYSVLSIWGMSVAYKRRADTEDDRLKAYELEQVRERERERETPTTMKFHGFMVHNFCDSECCEADERTALLYDEPGNLTVCCHGNTDVFSTLHSHTGSQSGAVQSNSGQEPLPTCEVQSQ